MSKPRISFLVPDINSPVIGPVTVLARILEATYAVEIVGPDLGHGICPMYRGGYPYKSVTTPRLYRFPDFLWESRRIGKALEGDLVIAVKAYMDTIPLALWEKWRRGKKAVAYLDEWDGSLIRMMSSSKRRAALRKGWYRPLDDIWYPAIERLIPGLDSVLSTTTWLQRKFGGHIVHMGVDTAYFKPPPADVTLTLKKECGLEKGKHIVFGGVVRPHKGIELILDALALIGNPAFRLAIVGPVNEHVEALKASERYAPYLIALGPKPKDEMPKYLSMADLMVMPLSDNLLAQSQMPCKIFEAMAMAKPVIGSAVADLPLVLEGCGKIVPSDNVETLAVAINEVLTDDQLATEMGRKAREKCIREYSAEVTRNNLLKIIGEVLG